jgi:hypothetical protein
MTPAEQFAAILAQPRAYILTSEACLESLREACAPGGCWHEAVTAAGRQVPVYTSPYMDPEDATLYAIDPDSMTASPEGLEGWVLNPAGHVGGS